MEPSTATSSSTKTTTTTSTMVSNQVPIRLYGTWACQFTHRVELALKLKGLTFEFNEEDLHAKNTTIIHYSPIYKKVPILVHNNHAIAESMIILQYIDEVWPEVNTILPKDPFERAIVRFWCNFVDEMLGPTIGMVFQSVGHRQKATLEQFHQILMIVENELQEGYFKEKRFFGGDQIGILDIVIGAGSYWFAVFEVVLNITVIDEEIFPRFTSWLRKFEELPEVREVTPPFEVVLDHAMGLRKMIVMSYDVGDEEEDDDVV